MEAGEVCRELLSQVQSTGQLVVDWGQYSVFNIKHLLKSISKCESCFCSQSPVSSKSTETYTVEHLNSSLFYTVQIQCVKNQKCSQCLWSDAYNVPPGQFTATLNVTSLKKHQYLYVSWSTHFQNWPKSLSLSSTEIPSLQREEAVGCFI